METPSAAEQIDRIVRRIKPRPTWQPIETAPTNTPVLVVVEGFVGEARLHDGDGDEGEWWWANEYKDYHADKIYPTHWMPLPDPPA